MTSADHGGKVRRANHESSICPALENMKQCRRADGACPRTNRTFESRQYCRDKVRVTRMARLNLRRPSRRRERVGIKHGGEHRQVSLVEAAQQLGERPSPDPMRQLLCLLTDRQCDGIQLVLSREKGRHHSSRAPHTKHELDRPILAPVQSKLNRLKAILKLPGLSSD